jgi:AcrR family transcriptional regulator
MASDVKPTRPYDSPRRREQAAATRQAILEAAERLFQHQGYVATSVAAIAQEARVAHKTVYAAFGTKAEVLRALWNLRMRGDEEPVPLYERPWYREIIAEPDPARRLGLLAHYSRLVKERTADVLEIVRQATPADPRIAEVWERFQTDFYAIGMRGIVDSLDRDGVLAPDPVAAADILWTLNHPDVYQLLVRLRGWTPLDYEHWLGAVLRQQLLVGTRGVPRDATSSR